MASVVHLLLLISLISFSKSDREFLSLDGSTEYHGVYGQRSLLNCTAKSNLEEKKLFTIRNVVWKKEGEILLMFHKENLIHDRDGFQFADPNWKVTKNVSLLLTNTKMSDMGKYECLVNTDIGHKTFTTKLSVTAKYQTPTLSSVPAENFKENTDITLFCNATGGDQTGSIHWFDERGTNWTKSSELTVSKTENGMFNLFSSFKVSKASSSTSTNYTCSVFNARGAQDAKASLSLQFMNLLPEPAGYSAGDYHARYVAPLVVIGSLIVGLLILILYRRRSRNIRRPSTVPLMSNGHNPVIREEDVAP